MHRWRVYKSIISSHWFAMSLFTYWSFEFDTWQEALNFALGDGAGPIFTHH